MEKQEYQTMFEIENDFWWYRGLQELVISSVKKYIPNSEAKIYDAGCGTGRILELVADAGYVNASGGDYSQDAVDFCLKRDLKNIVKEDLNIWVPPIDAYAAVISLDVICNVDDDVAVIKKFATSLKPGGILILNLPAFKILRRNHDLTVWSKRRFRRDLVGKALKEAGLKTEIISYRLPWLFPIVLVKKIVERLSKAQAKQSDLETLPVWLNNLFLSLNRWENKLILKNISMPIGSSLFVICKKDGN